MAVLIVMVLVILKFTGGTPKSPISPQSAPSAAAIASCRADVAGIEQALSVYQRLNGHAPPAGTAWATSAAGGTPYLQSWPGLAHAFTIVWDGTRLTVSTPRGAGCAHA